MGNLDVAKVGLGYVSGDAAALGHARGCWNHIQDVGTGTAEQAVCHTGATAGCPSIMSFQCVLLRAEGAKDGHPKTCLCDIDYLKLVTFKEQKTQEDPMTSPLTS